MLVSPTLHHTIRYQPYRALTWWYSACDLYQYIASYCFYGYKMNIDQY